MAEEPDIPKSGSLLGRWNLKTDKIIPILVIFLSIVSIVMVYSMRGNVVLQHLKHLLFGFIGLYVFYKFDYRKLGVAAPAALVVAILLLIFTLLSQAVRGVTIFGRDVQTFYFIGFLVIFYISNYIARQYHKHGELSQSNVHFLFALLLLFCLFIAMMNMSTAIILFVTGLVIFFVGGVSMKDLGWLVGGVSIVLILAVIVVANLSDDKKAKIGRMATFINRWEYYITKDNSNGYGDQMILARSAIARSGFNPAGPGKGVIKNRLPEKETDYAFASLFEETGIVVGVAVLFAYLIIFYRSRKIAKEATGTFGRLLAFGIGFWFTCQALVHIGVNCELLPTTGQTLPFISSGGASLFVSGCAIGMLLNIGKISTEESEKEDPTQLLQQR
ncbi:MAG: FtsW/RodA/SpoVE family cell cycle protein [Bacteroidales bacterium]|nr:FtsW/RodA/SpoVE family cell cycle protein [Bacteroidales bacterium]